VIGAARLLRLMRAGWIAPVERGPSRVLFSAREVRAAIRRMELERCPPDTLEVLRIRTSELRHGRQRVRKVRPPKPSLADLVIDFSAFDPAHVPDGQNTQFA
jgi:hypothetical protein